MGNEIILAPLVAPPPIDSKRTYLSLVEEWIFHLYCFRCSSRRIILDRWWIERSCVLWFLWNERDWNNIFEGRIENRWMDPVYYSFWLIYERRDPIDSERNEKNNSFRVSKYYSIKLLSKVYFYELTILSNI